MIAPAVNIVVGPPSIKTLFHIQDAETQHHAYRVGKLSAKLAMRIGFPQEKIGEVLLGGMLHDIGKIFTPPEIINKPGNLSAEELDTMRKHAEMGYSFLYGFTDNSIILNMVQYHHERWNGTGYPYGFGGEAIPLEARICAIADVWDALTADRCYRPAWSKLQALEQIQSWTGSLFDPAVADQFFDLVSDRVLLQRSEVLPISISEKLPREREVYSVGQ